MIERIVRVSTGVNQDGLRLSVIDDSSSTVLAELRLDPEQLWTFLRGGTLDTKAKISDHLDRVGKTMVNHKVIVPQSLLSFEMNRYERENTGLEWAEDEHPGWDTYSAVSTNSGGVAVVMRKWTG